jgi:hypothetical protein
VPAGAADALGAKLGLRCRVELRLSRKQHSIISLIQASSATEYAGPAHDREPDGNRSPVAARDLARNSRRPCILEKHGRCFLADHDRGRIGIATDDLRHD